MRIIKEHSYDILRLYINQVGITIFSMFLYFAIGSIDEAALFRNLRIAVSVFSILFYFVLIYNVVWEIGAKDKIRIESGGYTARPLKGMVMALFANIPNLILAGASTLFGFLYTVCGVKWAE